MSNFLEKLKSHKKSIIIISAVIIAIVAITVILCCVLNKKPSKYEEKVKDLAKAFYDESKMKQIIGDNIVDLKASAAWIKTIDDSMDDINIEENIKELNAELKDTNKDDDEVKELKEALKDYANLREKDDTRIKVKNIKKPKQSKNNKKVWTVEATWDYGEYGDEKMIYIFYNGKIIDVGEYDKEDSTMESFFKMTVEYYNL